MQVKITPLTTKRTEHSGIKVQLLGQIELASERGSFHDFVALGVYQGVAETSKDRHGYVCSMQAFVPNIIFLI